MNNYEVAIIGGSAAGLSAALVLSRARRNVVVIDAGEPRNAPADHMNGFLSRDGLAPSELLAIGRAEVAGYGGHLLSGRATAVGRVSEGAFDVRLANGSALRARRILITTGLTDQIPDLPGIRERWGRDVLHCPYCHGYEVRDQAVAVLGGTAGSLQHAQLVRQWSSDVVYFPHTDILSADEREQLVARSIGVVDGVVARMVVSDDRLGGVELTDGRVIRRTAVFVRPTLVPNADLVRSLGCATDDRGLVIADPTGRTSAPGVWVAGNVADVRAQVITAAGEGSSAAIAINADLVEEDVRAAVTSFRLGLPDPHRSHSHV